MAGAEMTETPGAQRPRNGATVTRNGRVYGQGGRVAFSIFGSVWIQKKLVL